jgi:CRP-like cAMP-binding protein
MTPIKQWNKADRHLAYLGDILRGQNLIIELISQGVPVNLLPQITEGINASLLLVNIEDGMTGIFEQIRKLDTVWIAWCHGSVQLVSQAYQSGAAAVFPDETDIQTICLFIQRQLAKTSEEEKFKDSIQRQYRRGDLILLDPEMVLEIKQGIIAQLMIHKDGCEVLLGLFGQKDYIFPHPADNCYIQLVAQTDCIVSIEPVAIAEHKPGFSHDLRFCLQKVEAWAAMQARPHLDQRLMGILSLLAEEFGREVDQGRLVDLRLTHAQLASAIGSTRATVTRTISDLKSQGKLTTIYTIDGERYCLVEWETCSHSSSD